jgi:AP endonuclease-1
MRRSKRSRATCGGNSTPEAAKKEYKISPPKERQRLDPERIQTQKETIDRPKEISVSETHEDSSLAASHVNGKQIEKSALSKQRPGKAVRAAEGEHQEERERESTEVNINKRTEKTRERGKRKTKAEKAAEMTPLAARTPGLRMYVGAHVSAAKGVCFAARISPPPPFWL